jgi:hypothetical protein
MSAYLHIIYNYDFFLACFYYEFLTKCSFISRYVLKYMLRVGCGQVSQNLPYFDLSVAYAYPHFLLLIPHHTLDFIFGKVNT